MKNKINLMVLFMLAVLGSLALSACGASTPAPTPTLSIQAVQTNAVGTFAAGLTQTAFAMPTNTATPTLTATLTSTPTRSTPLPPGGGIVPTATCYGLTGVSDVTIPDNTAMVAGQAFVKTWLVKNTGTCAWETGFKFAFIGGDDDMDGVTLILDAPVAVGAEKQLSVSMTAPNKTGTIRSNWQMSTASGAYFGDVQWVIIEWRRRSSPRSSRWRRIERAE
jgi:hypothetical protein